MVHQHEAASKRLRFPPLIRLPLARVSPNIAPAIIARDVQAVSRMTIDHLARLVVGPHLIPVAITAVRCNIACSIVVRNIEELTTLAVAQDALPQDRTTAVDEEGLVRIPPAIMGSKVAVVVAHAKASSTAAISDRCKHWLLHPIEQPRRKRTMEVPMLRCPPRHQGSGLDVPPDLFKHKATRSASDCERTRGHVKHETQDPRLVSMAIAEVCANASRAIIAGHIDTIPRLCVASQFTRVPFNAVVQLLFEQSPGMACPIRAVGVAKQNLHRC
mmetsp:Transcript_48647/g.122747  ORF Transcript_48647/g.122747 Transcript_48647/m.122747 type:complete len:273 (+) Transcript_48647:669-1487(+)